MGDEGGKKDDLGNYGLIRIRDCTGASAGASSSTFHKYRQMKRREQNRLYKLQQEEKREKSNALLASKRFLYNLREEEKRAKKRAKRERQKANKKRKLAEAKAEAADAKKTEEEKKAEK